MTKYEDLRPCLLTTLNGDVPAKFHKWLPATLEAKGQIYGFGVVEHESGRCEVTLCRNIRFTDHQPPDQKKEEEPQKQEEPEVTYKLGDRFIYTGCTDYWKAEYRNFREFLLVSLGGDYVGFVNVETGRFIGQAVCPQDCDRLTAEEFSNLCGSHEEFEFKLITKEDSNNGQN